MSQPDLNFTITGSLPFFSGKKPAAMSCWSLGEVAPRFCFKCPTRLHRPWDSPGKNTGVGCHFLLQCMKVKSESEVTQSCPTLRDTMDYSLPGSSIHGISQTAQGPCVAKFGPLPSKWQMPSPEPSCVNKTADWRLKILQNGLYLIYGQVAPNTAYKGRAPFEVQLRKNEDPIQALTNNSMIQNVGGAYEFHAGDVIDLIFNAEHQVLKNKTYWGIFLLTNPQFIS
uniref:Tumor necrosis factor ligand superfamily member 18 n=1 Tax=Bos taurus TaxID=9913 RepID=A0AAA9TDR7_BOVIN